MKDGGQAFPIFNERGISYFGMSLRDYFAGQALMGLCAARAEGKHYLVAGWAYKLADAMLEEKEKEPK